ncbi:hypothetical protein M8C21_017291 [Ambrosia artemisiifolia]|uniref:Uncharacterized protein n=1 Tax=Ambrosia artemisiifolia TaxID=4212 RepID=A0AAD5BLF2_AMBAR|nr:hypothetical protein M8C21_017291 [Ambrosia artemisiifolia]
MVPFFFKHDDLYLLEAVYLTVDCVKEDIYFSFVVSSSSLREGNFYYLSVAPQKVGLNKIQWQHASRERPIKIDRGILFISMEYLKNMNLLYPSLLRKLCAQVQKAIGEKRCNTFLLKCIQVQISKHAGWGMMIGHSGYPSVQSSKVNPVIVKFEDDVYLSTNEPHGSIEASLNYPCPKCQSLTVHDSSCFIL